MDGGLRKQPILLRIGLRYFGRRWRLLGQHQGRLLDMAKTPEEQRAWRRARALKQGHVIKDRRLPGTRTPEEAKEQARMASQRYRERNPEKRREIVLRWAREKGYKRWQEKYKTDIQYHLALKNRRRVRTALKYYLGKQHKNCKASTRKLIGGSYADMASHLELLFQPGMSWEGVFSKQIELDHVVPCAAFDLTDPVQLALCFHYKNLQPLWRKDNQRKNSSTDEAAMTALKERVYAVEQPCFSPISSMQ